MEANPAQSSSAPLTIRLFGPFEVEVEGRPLPPVRSRRIRWLLAILAMRPGATLQRDWLAATLWPDSIEDRALYNLRHGLKDLRGAMGAQQGRLHATPRTLGLDLEGAFCDVAEFDAAVRSGTTEALERAVSLYRGELLSGCMEEWVPGERDARERTYVRALETLATRAVEQGEFAASASLWRQVVRVDPLRESAHRELMRALAADGDLAASLGIYRELRLLLHRELNTPTDPETSTLFEELRSRARAVARPARVHSIEVISSTPVAPPSCNLPRPLTRLIGRESEVADVVMRLGRARLVTLTGAGGVGKTRLATEIGHALTERYPDGVFFVDLAPLAQEAQVEPAVANALGLYEESERPLLATLGESLKRRSLLLILDNCEHLLDACARLSASLLSTAGEMRLLATSRQALGVTGEAIYRVPSLPTPAVGDLPLVDKNLLPIVMEYEAVQLFVERAQAVRPEFEVTGENIMVVAHLCERLDGIPLAIELAAVRVRSLSLDQIVSRLDDRFRLLTSGSRSALPRQQTLRALIDWSYELLDAQEQQLLQRLSVFAGGHTLGAAEAVCGEGVLDLLTSLVDKSLVQYEEHRSIGRYRLLETVREYGQDRLKESGTVAEIQRRHRDYFLAFVEQVDRDLRGRDQKAWVECLQMEHDNLLAALSWCHQEASDVRIGPHLANLLKSFWRYRGYWSEGRRQYEALLSRPEVQVRTPLRGDVLAGAGEFATLQGDYARAYDLLEESIELHQESGNWLKAAAALTALARIATERGDYAMAIEHCNDALAIAREQGNLSAEAGHHNNLGAIAQQQGRHAEARSHYGEALRINRALGNRNWEGINLGNLGVIANENGDYEEAHSCFEEALRIHRGIGNRASEGDDLTNLGQVAMRQGNYTAAQYFLEQALLIQRELGNQASVAFLLGSLGAAVAELTDYARARSCYEQALLIDRELGRRDAEASDLCGLGRVAEHQEEYEEAGLLQKQALEIRRSLRHTSGSYESLRACASLSANLAQYERAAILYGAVEKLRESLGLNQPPDNSGSHIEAVRHDMGNEAFQAAWEKGRAMSCEQAIDYALREETILC